MLIFPLLLLLLASPANAHIVSVDTAGNVGGYTALTVVNGNPAISYFDLVNGDLKYVRAADASGTTWGTPVSVDTGGFVGEHTSLAVVNGNPAISYYDLVNGDLKYVRAADASGTTWGTPVSVDTAGNVGGYTALTVVNGNPAISYYDNTNGDLKYVRATDASGTTWGTPVSVDTVGHVGLYTALTVVNGNPAISYYDNTNGDLKYVRAADASGTTWGTPVSVDTGGFVGEHTSLAVVNGNPAISYYDNTNGGLKYVRATDAGGTTWGTPVSVDTGGGYTTLSVVNGNPAIGYFGTSVDLKYVRATDAGGTTWGTPVSIDTAVDVGRFAALTVVNGNPAISYYDYSNGDLKFARATDSNGSNWVDTTAPTLSSVGVSSTSSSGTTLSATSNEAATGYWIAVAQGSTAPTAAQVKAGVTYSGITIVASGNAAMTAATPKTFSVTGLAASTAYTLYIVAEDGSSNLSTASSANVTTSAAAVNGTCGSANGLAFASTPASNLCTDGTPGTVSAAAGSYTWTCAGSGGGSTANCAATRSYTVSVSVGSGGSISPAGATVIYNAIQAFAISPASGYQLAAIAGCGGTLSGSNFTTAAITADCTVTASFSALVVTPTEPPPPPPPPPPPTLPSGGGDLSVAAGGTVVINNNGSAGSTLTLTGSGRTQINLGGGTLTVDTTGTTRFTLVRASDGSLALRVDDASFTVGGGNQPLLVAGGLALNGQGGNNSLRVLYVGGKLRKFAVLTGSILLPGNSFAAASGLLHAGEVAEFDANERVTARYLGSFEGNAGQIGDRLPTFSNALAIPAGVPILTALPERQRAGGQSLTLDRQLTQVLLPYGLGAIGQDSQGVIRIVGNDTSLYAAQPLGRVQVADGEANGLSFNADGSARTVVNGYAFLLVPAVADPSGLANAMAAQRPGTSASLGVEGEWRFTESSGRVTVVRPGWNLTFSNNGTGLRTNASGNLFFAHDSLFGSMLFPAVADRARILAAARQLDPAATLVSTAGGETVLTLSGQRYVLSPESVLVEVPAAHANDPFWVEGGKLFVPAGNGKAQGFGVR